MKNLFPILLVALCFTIILAKSTQVDEMDIEELQFTKKLIEAKLSQYEQPWRWYQIVGIGIAILIGFQCARCCLPLCLGCGVMCCGIAWAIIAQKLGLVTPTNRQQNHPEQQQTTEPKHKISDYPSQTNQQEDSQQGTQKEKNN